MTSAPAGAERDEGRRAGGGTLRPQRRLGDHTLRVPRLPREHRRQQRRQLGTVELAHVVVVLDPAALVVDRAVRRRDDERARRRQHAAELGEHCLLRGEVLDRLERHDEVHARVRQRQRGDRRRRELEVGARVAFARVRDRLRGHVDAGHVRRVLREQVAAVALAARGVEHALPGRERRHRGVAVPVLVPDRPAHVRQEALAGERERGGGVGGGGQGGGGVGTAAVPVREPAANPIL